MSKDIDQLVKEIEESANEQWEVIELTAQELSDLKGGDDDE